MLKASLAILLVVASVDLVQPAKLTQSTSSAKPAAATGGKQAAGGGACFNPAKDGYDFYGTRTAYSEKIHGQISIPDKTCKPVQIWALIRHGSKYPDKKAMPKILLLPKLRDQIVKNHEAGSGQLCPKDLQNLKNWKLEWTEAQGEKLAPEGRAELRLLGERLKKAFPQLLQGASPTDFYFRTTNAERTIESMRSFAEGLMANPKSAKLTPAPKNDTLLEAFSSCPAWLRGDKDKNIYIERDAFAKTPEFQGVMKSVGTRLGFKEPVDMKVLQNLYNACRYESALNRKQPSVWCPVFTKEELKIKEYHEDVAKYYYVGPGQKICPAVSCWLMADMFQHFDGASTGSKKEPKAVFYFGHSKNLMTFMSSLKIGVEAKPLVGSGYKTSQNRKFRSSILGPFAANVIAVLNKCGSANKVVFYVSEKLTPVASCSSDGTCELKALQTAYKDRSFNCNLKLCY